MVKSKESGAQALSELGYYSGSRSATVDTLPVRPKSGSSVGAAAGNQRNSGDRKRIYPDELRHMRRRAKLRSPRRIHPELLFVAKAALLCSSVCAIMLIMVTAHMRVAANDRQIQLLTSGIQQAQAEQEALTNQVYIERNQQRIAAMATKYHMVQSSSPVTVALTLNPGESLLSPQQEIAQAQ